MLNLNNLFLHVKFLYKDVNPSEAICSSTLDFTLKVIFTTYEWD